jgi:hypothetical protein
MILILRTLEKALNIVEPLQNKIKILQLINIEVNRIWKQSNLKKTDWSWLSKQLPYIVPFNCRVLLRESDGDSLSVSIEWDVYNSQSTKNTYIFNLVGDYEDFDYEIVEKPIVKG